MRHKKAENLSFADCGRKFEVLPKLIQNWEKQYETGRKYKVTTDSAHALPVAPNLLAQDFSCNTCPESASHAKVPDQVWLSDITHLWTTEGWLYVPVPVSLADDCWLSAS